MVITKRQLKKAVKQYNKHLLPGESRITADEYALINALIVINRKPTVASISKARVQAIIDEDREDSDFPTCREKQCISCWHRIYLKNDMSHVDICTLGLDMDRLETCTEWANQHSFSMKQAEAMLK